QFTQTAMQPIQCLTVVGNTLYACMGSPHAFALQVLGVSTDEGATLTPGFQFTCVSSPLACPAGSKTAACASDWSALQASFGPSQGVTRNGAGAAEGSSSFDAGEAGVASSNGKGDGDASLQVAPASGDAGCGCGLREGGQGPAAAILAAGLAWMAR